MYEYGVLTGRMLGFMIEPKIWTPLVLQSIHESHTAPHVQGKIWTSRVLQSIHESPTAPHVQGIIWSPLVLQNVHEFPTEPHVQGIIWTPLELQSVHESPNVQYTTITSLCTPYISSYFKRKGQTNLNR